MPRPLHLCVITVALTLLLCSAAIAVNWDDFTELRHISGLPGNGFAVNEHGQVGFGGAFHMNVPCAYTPSAGNYALSYYAASMDNKIRFQFRGEATDGTGHVGLGFGKPGNGFYVSELFVEQNFNANCMSAQWQVLDEDHSRNRPALAIGVLDIFDQREAENKEPNSARSFYLTATQEVSTGDRPIYLTLGFGNGRFGDHPFGAITWHPATSCILGFEYDGLVTRPYAAYHLVEGGKWDITTALAWSDFERPVLGFSVTYKR